MTTDEKIQLIGQKIFVLSNNLDKYKAELDLLKQQLESLKAEKEHGKAVYTAPIVPPSVIEEPAIKNEPAIVSEQRIVPPLQQPAQPVSRPVQPQRKPVDMEEYIGGNLIAKIGIVILVIGIAIGVKYAIDRELISPLTRIVLGYLAGGVLLAIALRLKKNFTAFSAVLLSGGMATLYFVTFAAYAMYALMPQVAAFGLMVVFTAFTVFAATMYNQEWIGIFGLVGAYAVPMLLDEHSGKAHILFIYMTIINTGILILSFRKYWQVLTYVAYALSWVIFSGWFFTRYDHAANSTTALVFSFVFFITFYISFISYKTIRKEAFVFRDIVLVLLNSFIYFSIGYAIFSRIPYEAPGEGKYLGLFTLANALIHLGFAYSVFVNKQVDRKLFYLIMALVLCFATIAVPVQLEGHWVTLFWIAEMFLLFWIGRVKQVRFYEWMSFIMIPLAVLSLVHDWRVYYTSTYNDLLKYWTPIANITFLTSIMAVASLGGMMYIYRTRPLPLEERKRFDIYGVIDYALPAILVLITYFTFSNEIINYFDSVIQKTAVQIDLKGDIAYGTGVTYDYDLTLFETLWRLNYTMLFILILGLVVKKLWRNEVIGWIVWSLEALTILLFLIIGLITLESLRENYLAMYNAEYFHIGAAYIWMRYICFAFLALLAWGMYSRMALHQQSKQVRAFMIPFLHIVVLTVLSSELTNIIVLTHPEDQYRFESISHKMGYTVLWGLYSFALIAFGIMRKSKSLRISAIVLFAITLIKLFAFDIIDLSTGYKVVAFTALGILLLVVSFLYQKFKTLIFGDDEQNG
jgi:uncharacterized membrane protein